MKRFKSAGVLLVLGVAVLLAIGSCAQTYYEGPTSANFDGRAFFIADAPRPTTDGDFWRWQFNRSPGPWPKWVDNETTDIPPAKVGGEALRVSFVNHATVLLQTHGLNIITDPTWDDFASPVTFAGPKRVRAPGIAFENLPKIDVILISHNHYDHLSVRTLAKIWHRDRPRIIAPLGNDTIIRDHDDAVQVETLDWGQSLDIAPDVKVSLEPMQHWSARTRWDTNHALWGAFVIQAPGGPIYFVGDTGYAGGRHYRDATAKYGPFRFAIMPIGAYLPRWFMAYAHQSPEEAVRGHLDARVCFSLASQHSTFPMADDGYEEPLRDLAAGRVQHGVPEANFRALMNGQHWIVPAMIKGADGTFECDQANG